MKEDGHTTRTAMMKSIYDPARGVMRVVGYCSGSGNTLWKALEQQKKMESAGETCPYEIVGVFTDKPGSKCLAVADQYGIPTACIDIREFYVQRGADMKDMEIRREYDRAALPLVLEMKPDMILLAGYVWAVTEVIMDAIPVVGVHPGDLTVQENGRRLLAGANGVKAAFRYNRPEVRASSYLATSELDGGPILITSPAVPVDYTLHSDEEERFRYYLKLVNEQNRLVGAMTLLEMAKGYFGRNEDGSYCYKGEPAPLGIKLESWEKEA